MVQVCFGCEVHSGALLSRWEGPRAGLHLLLFHLMRPPVRKLASPSSPPFLLCRTKDPRPNTHRAMHSLDPRPFSQPAVQPVGSTESPQAKVP